MKKHVVAFATLAAALTLVGCATSPTEPKHSPAELSEAQDDFDRCLEATGIRQIYSYCMGSQPLIKRLGPDAEEEAKQRWDDIVENSGPNPKLMAAVLRHNTKMLEEAVAEGADVNVVMSKAEAYGGYDGDYDHENVTPLGVAIEALYIDIALKLMDHGADINWRDPDDPTRDVASDSWPGKAVHWSDRSTYSWDPIFVLLGQGYTPSAKTLFAWYRGAYHNRIPKPEYEEAFLALKAKAKPDDFAKFERLAEEAAAEDKRIEEENAKRRAEDDKRREEARARLQAMTAELEEATRQRTQHMRHVGAKICQNVQTRMSNFVRVGYVERLADKKVQIRVAHMHLRGAPTITPGGFQPEIIWDSLSNWYSCE